jgi:hypothetical protein
MRGTRLETEVEICATNLANKTKCMSTNAKKWKRFCENFFVKHNCKYKKGLGSAHQALCSTFLLTSFSITAVSLRF